MYKPYKVVVADDYRISRTFFEMMVQSNDRYELTASFASAFDAVAYCLRYPVDLVIMDILMRTGIDGLTAAQQIKEQRPEIKIILATSTAETLWQDNARMIGVESFWYKEYSKEPLNEVMDRTMAGESVYPESIADVNLGDVTRVNLTARDLDVLRELTHGYTNEEIADKLGISINTVRTHVRNMLNKTGYKTRLALVVNAATLGIVVNDERRKGSGSYESANDSE